MWTISLLLVFPFFASLASSQTASSQSEDEKQRSTLEVEAGPPTIKQKDLWNESGYFHPFLRMPRYILQDQKAIWTSPLHTAKPDAKWWAIFGAATAVLIA